MKGIDPDTKYRVVLRDGKEFVGKYVCRIRDNLVFDLRPMGASRLAVPDNVIIQIYKTTANIRPVGPKVEETRVR